MRNADDVEIAEALARARRGLSPGPGDLERVRSGLDAALRAPRPAVPDRAPGRPAWQRWVERLALAGALTGTGAAVGYQAGRRAERRDQPALQAGAPPATPALAAPPNAPPDGKARAPQPAAEAPRLEQHHRHVTAGGGQPSAAASLAAEVRALRNVERALREQNPGLAGAFLDGLDREIPGGQMQEERAALRTIARCAAGDRPFGIDLAEEFTQAFPSSAYRARVEEACGRTDSRPAGDSAGRR